jgi:hypothetical protein
VQPTAHAPVTATTVASEKPQPRTVPAKLP